MHNLCRGFFSKIIFDQRLSSCCHEFDYPGSILYLSCYHGLIVIFSMLPPLPMKVASLVAYNLPRLLLLLAFLLLKIACCVRISFMRLMIWKKFKNTELQLQNNSTITNKKCVWLAWKEHRLYHTFHTLWIFLAGCQITSQETILSVYCNETALCLVNKYSY